MEAHLEFWFWGAAQNPFGRLSIRNLGRYLDMGICCFLALSLEFYIVETTLRNVGPERPRKVSIHRVLRWVELKRMPSALICVIRGIDFQLEVLTRTGHPEYGIALSLAQTYRIVFVGFVIIRVIDFDLSIRLSKLDILRIARLQICRCARQEGFGSLGRGAGT